MRLVVLGAGESGVGTALLGKQKGYEVFVSDASEIQEKYKNVLLHHGIDFEEKQHTESLILSADVVMKSPGIPDRVPLIQALLKRGVAVVSEPEFAAQFSDAQWIAITGTNGKTTTTELTYYLLDAAGLSAAKMGNVGISMAGQVAAGGFDYGVLEISSFQLDGIRDFRPHIAVITNITPDHLDRYNYEFENYIASKFRIARNQKETDYLIYDYDDPVIREGLKKYPTRATPIPFSVKEKLEQGAYLENGMIRFSVNDKTMDMDAGLLPIEGLHNKKNAMAASIASLLVNVRKEELRKSIQHFQGVPHRLEKVLRIGGVEYINDSKATNVNACYYALEGIKKPIVWIAGGVDKGNDYMELMPLVREKVKAIICLGMDNTSLVDTFSPVADLMVETYSMEEAVKVANKVAQKGDTVLLSPACASFDLFKNYEDRGEQFKAAIRKL
ncbi:UDP-N-acetylmuramoyl-L-alanine--D-glutamate ligase [Aureicoccus marinus]|uniref:UDP-N-acetylmuramoylalanine--D-glutamate ligase n=1 Tax=Aureicoccus marinus TaxID=754435 RepID=A0A2S7T6Z8_9FLAO|nr:UDP-N-acetylmuramoyl-L-alanine--D-glutamate ligase [Aureicoccus marinus]PQJ15692.1 UDP-N-acetylmuramoylalanine--D-glutamate ligase [Aureicoccus marinus]